jgi:hypothetical protein
MAPPHDEQRISKARTERRHVQTKNERTEPLNELAVIEAHGERRSGEHARRLGVGSAAAGCGWDCPALGLQASNKQRSCEHEHKKRATKESMKNKLNLHDSFQKKCTDEIQLGTKLFPRNHRLRLTQAPGNSDQAKNSSFSPK